MVETQAMIFDQERETEPARPRRSRHHHFYSWNWDDGFPSGRRQSGAAAIGVDRGIGFDDPGYPGRGSGGSGSQKRKGRMNLGDNFFFLAWIAFCLTVIVIAMVVFGVR